jgi:FixJ family two-component response regulator
MPLMNGLEVQSQLHELSPSTRVIIFTGKGNPLIRSRALRGGATAFFTKPFDDEEFLTTVRLALSGT